jgi:type II secretory pathway component GspD/PulD (secretin)
MKLSQTAFVAACLALGCARLSAQALKADPARAEQAYVEGARLLERNDYAAAQASFSTAATLDATHPEYARAVELTRDKRVNDLVQQSARARMLQRPADADALMAQARALDPTNEAVQQHVADAASMTEAGTPPSRFDRATGAALASIAGPIHLTPKPGVQAVHLKGDARQAMTQLASQFGIKAQFDGDFTGPPLRLDLDATTYEQASEILFSMAHLFAVPLNETTLLVTKDTQDNRARLERQVEETVYIPGATVEQLNELLNIVKNVFDVRQVVASPLAGSLLIRAPEPVIRSVNYTLADLVDGGAEVLMRIQLISVDKTHTLNTGANTPTSIGAFSVAAEAQNLVNANQSLINAAISQGLLVLPAANSYAQNVLLEGLFLVLSGAVTDAKLTNLLTLVGGGLTLFGINYGGSAGFNLALNTSEARALDDISVRVGDRQTTALRVGSRYPVTTATYGSGLSAAQTSALAGVSINGQSASSLLAAASSIATVPTVQYEDLGITLKTQPTVMKSGLVAVHVDLKLEALTGASANGIPVLTSRAFVSDITVNDGGTAVMLSDLSKTEAASVSGIPGLAELPGLNSSVADRLGETDSSELVLLVTPTVVRRRSNEFASKRIRFQVAGPQDY